MKILGLHIARSGATLFVRYEGTKLTHMLGRHALCRFGFHNRRGWIFANDTVTYCTRCVMFEEAYERAVSNRGSVVLPEKEMVA